MRTTLLLVAFAIVAQACGKDDRPSAQGAATPGPAAPAGPARPARPAPKADEGPKIELLTRDPAAICESIFTAAVREQLGIKAAARAGINGSYHECDYGSRGDGVAFAIRCAKPGFPSSWRTAALDLKRKADEHFKTFEAELELGQGAYRAKPVTGSFGPRVLFIASHAPCVAEVSGADPVAIARAVDAAITLDAVK